MENPTAKDFIKVAWRWFKRNFGNIMLLLIFWELLLIMSSIDSLWLPMFEMQMDISSIRDNIEAIRFR